MNESVGDFSGAERWGRGDGNVTRMRAFACLCSCFLHDCRARVRVVKRGGVFRW